MPLEEQMISAIDSRYSSPVSIQVPQYINDIQDSAAGTPSKQKTGRIRTGVAECIDLFEQANKADQLKELKVVVEYNKIVEKQKAEHAKAYRPDQQGVTLHPSVTATPNVSLAADLSANMLSMIRV
jgi:hypothetical protein